MGLLLVLIYSVSEEAFKAAFHPRVNVREIPPVPDVGEGVVGFEGGGPVMPRMLPAAS